MFVWRWIALPGLLAFVLSFALVALIYLSRPDRPQNRRLAGLILSGAFGFLFYGPVRLLADDPASAFAALALGLAMFAVANSFFLSFLATLDSPFTRPLRPWPVQVLIFAAGGGVAATFLLRPDAVAVSIVPTPSGWYNVSAVGWLWVPATQYGGLAVTLFSLLVAFSAERRARGTAHHGAAKAYLVAFFARDVLLLSYLLLAVSPWQSLLYGFDWWVNFIWLAVDEVLFGILLAYGILRTQLFDVDLRIKWGVRRGTVVAAFLAVFLVSSSIAQIYLESYGAIAGGMAVGLLLFAVRPLERAADRFADRAMPRVRDDPEYVAVRKREVYQAAVEGALDDGGVSDKERAMLARLAQQLGLGPVEMLDIERAVRSRRAVPA